MPQTQEFPRFNRRVALVRGMWKAGGTLLYNHPRNVIGNTQPCYLAMNTPTHIHRYAFMCIGFCGILNPSSRHKDPASRILDLGSCILDPGSWIQGPGSRVLDHSFWIQDPGSRIQALIGAFHVLSAAAFFENSAQ